MKMGNIFSIFKKDNFFLILAFFLVIYASMTFWIGFHNYDLGQNIRYLESHYNSTIMDKASDGKLYESVDMMIVGVNQMRIGFLLSIVASILFGQNIRKSKEKKKL